jgi:hypothetical protein
MSFHYIESRQTRESNLRPLLTIGIPTWNREVALGEQISAIEANMTRDVELLICDNGSDDNTWSALEAIVKATSRRVRCIRNGTNLGADVNYLRIHEAATGEWTWLTGDDDPIDFSHLPAIVSALSSTGSTIVLLMDDAGCRPSAKLAITSVTVEEFFRPENDDLGVQILQVGRTLCRTAMARPFLRIAYASAVGKLHSYSCLYGPLVVESGIDVIRLSLLLDRQQKGPRWDILQAHLGAWESSLSMYGAFRQKARTREIRLRQRVLLLTVLGVLARNGALGVGNLKRLRRLLDLRGRAILTAFVISFGISHSLCLRLLRNLKPAFVAELDARGELSIHEY